MVLCTGKTWYYSKILGMAVRACRVNTLAYFDSLSLIKDKNANILEHFCKSQIERLNEL
jgi:hypothetical protein